MSRWTVLAVCVLGGAALAQDLEETSEVDLFELEEALVQVVSASQQEEPLRETPVPVTVITQDMIRAIGARNLQDVLLAYVPGMTLVADHNEMNVAMRGVYASSQQKILVMLDGHRLNSRAYSMANPDFSISLDKVSRIEVLRGPGSSLYGNVALTAVVNLITKTGKESPGVLVRAGLGNHGQQSGSVVVSSDLGDRGDVLLWASAFQATGERYEFDASEDIAASPQAGYALINGVRDPGSYDVGVRYRMGRFTFLGNSRFGKVIEPFTSAGVTGEGYDYEAIRTFRTVGPGIGSQSNHLEMKYVAPAFPGLEVEASAYYDSNEMMSVLVSSPAGNAIYLGWNDHAIGAIAQGRYDYALGGAGSGNATLGLQVDQMWLDDSVLPAMVANEWTRFADTSERQVLEPGSETIYSAFFQVKHRFADQFIFNVGIRYDNKDRYKGENVQDLSPRISVVYAPNNTFDVKLSYAQSFVDAPYWYRYNSLASYRGGEFLTPEYLRSVQLTPTVVLMDGALRNTLNVFYNDLSDFIFRNNQAAADEPIYQNAGLLRTVGVENEVAWVQPMYRVRGNFTYQHLIEGRDYGTSANEIWNVPQFVGNVIADVQPLPSLVRGLWLNANARYVSDQLSPIDVTFRDSTGAVVNQFQELDNRVAGYFLLNLGVRVSEIPYVPGLSMDFTVNNVLGQRYFQGGSVVHPYPQPGRWFLARVGYTFE